MARSTRIPTLSPSPSPSSSRATPRAVAKSHRAWSSPLGSPGPARLQQLLHASFCELTSLFHDDVAIDHLQLLREWRRLIDLYKVAAAADCDPEEHDGSGDVQDDAENENEYELAPRSPFAI